MNSPGMSESILAWKGEDEIRSLHLLFTHLDLKRLFIGRWEHISISKSLFWKIISLILIWVFSILYISSSGELKKWNPQEKYQLYKSH